jgi:electron transport complex protein RnfG
VNAEAARNTTVPAAPAGASESGLKMVLTMAGIGLVCGILIVLTFQLTLPTIERNKLNALERAIFQVVPGAEKKVTFEYADGALRPAEATGSGAPKYYACYDRENRLVGVALEAWGQGFQDVIRVLYGYSPSKQAVVGMKVLESKETPGLGDKIGKDPVFKSNFDSLEVAAALDGRAIAHPVVLVKRGQKTESWQIEAITGATISSRSVTQILEKSTAEAVPVILDNLAALENGAK